MYKSLEMARQCSLCGSAFICSAAHSVGPFILATGIFQFWEYFFGIIVLRFSPFRLLILFFWKSYYPALGCPGQRL